MAYRVIVMPSAERELLTVRVYERRQISEAIDEQLLHQPTIETRNRKCVATVKPAFEHSAPLWELRVGEWRVFYDVDEMAQVVNVRAVRQKPPGVTTEEIIDEGANG